jgi:hypothetical protein
MARAGEAIEQHGGRRTTDPPRTSRAGGRGRVKRRNVDELRLGFRGTLARPAVACRARLPHRLSPVDLVLTPTALAALLQRQQGAAPRRA